MSPSRSTARAESPAAAPPSGAVLTETRSATSFADIARAMTAPGSLLRTQALVTQLAIEVISGCDVAQLALIGHRGELTVVERAGRQAGTPGAAPGHDSPATEALRTGMCTVDDLATDPRWPRLAAWAAERGLTSLCGVRLESDRQSLGVLELYGAAPGAFPEAGRQRVAIYATHAALALDGAAVEARLSEAITTRQTIGQAVGILMERHGVGAGYAFGLMARASSERNVKVRDLAAAIVTTGADPMLAEISPTVQSDPPEPPEPPGGVDVLTDGRLGLRLFGALEDTDAARVREALATVRSAPDVDIHLELGDLDFIAVSALRPLIDAAVAVEDRGGRLLLHDPPASLTRLLAVMLAGYGPLDNTPFVIDGAAPSNDPFVVGGRLARRS